MKVSISPNKTELGQRAASDGAALIRSALESQSEVAIIVATGASQFEMISALVEEPGIDWSRVTAFHLDEYVGVEATHPASFRKYLKERFVEKVPIGKFHYVGGEGVVESNAPADQPTECDRLGTLIADHTIEVAFVGIGENGHLAFNDPPADFETEVPYLIVNLDEDCRKQQLGEGWFKTLEEVPLQAVSMSIRHILKSKHIICSVPDERKAKAVCASVEGPVTPKVPASIMQQHAHTTLYLDQASASLLQKPS